MSKIIQIANYKKPALNAEFFMEKYGISRGKALSFMKNTNELHAYFVGKSLFVEEDDYLNFLQLARLTGGKQIPFLS